MTFQEDIIREAAGGPKAPQITTEVLVGNPAKINRAGKTRRTACKGGCGRHTWDAYCRKCRRKLERSRRKLERRKR